MKKVIFIIIIMSCFSFVQAQDEIPKLYLYGNIAGMNDKSDVRNVEVKYTSKDLNFMSYATLKIQGDSSLMYEKKNYNISLFEDSNHQIINYVDVKWGKKNKYTLKANWIDKTHSRNIATARIVAQMQKKYGLFNYHINNGMVDGFPVEIYIEDEFLGLYTWNLHKDSLFDIDNKSENYLVISGQEHTDIARFKQEADNNWKDFEVEVGKENNETLAKLNRLINFINNSTDEEFKKNFENYLNLDSVLNYYCFMRFAQLIDNIDNNLMLVTYDGDIWYTALYDLDTSWGIFWDGKQLLNFRDTIANEIHDSKLWRRLEQNFPNHIVVRYNELRQEILTEENIMNEFYNFYNTIPKTSFILEEQRYLNIPGYDLESIRKFLKIRPNVIDKAINELKTDEYDIVYKSFSIDKTDDIQLVNNENTDKSKVIVINAVFFFIVIIVILLYLRKRSSYNCF